MQQHVDDVLLLRRHVGRQRLALLTQPLLKVDDAAPPKVILLVLDPDKAAWLQERESVGGVVEDVAQVFVLDLELLTDLVVFPNVVFVRNLDLRLGLLQLSELYAS